jgi:hypothetical protein
VSIPRGAEGKLSTLNPYNPLIWPFMQCNELQDEKVIFLKLEIGKVKLPSAENKYTKRSYLMQVK